MISDDEITAMRERLVQTTPGPWTSLVEGRDFLSGSSFIQTAGDDVELAGATIADQDFIAHARQDMALLLDEIERLRRP
jgi:hypothetical protein